MKFHTRTGVLSSCGATLFIGKNRSLMRKLPLPLLCNGSSRRILLWQLPFCFALKSPFLHSSTATSHHRPLSVSFINEVLLFLIGLANCSTKVFRSSTQIFYQNINYISHFSALSEGTISAVVSTASASFISLFTALSNLPSLDMVQRFESPS